MHRLVFRTAAVLSLFAAVACSQNASAPVAITKTDALVAGCTKVGDVSARSSTPDTNVNEDLTLAARRAGGNYVLVTADNARKGTAYRCEQGAPAAR